MKLSLVVGIGFTLLAGSGTIAQQPSSELADGPGKDVVVRVCAECHEPASRISKFKKSESEWADIITDMQNRGMMADDKEIEVVLAYLTKQYGPSAPSISLGTPRGVPTSGSMIGRTPCTSTRRNASPAAIAPTSVRWARSTSIR